MDTKFTFKNALLAFFLGGSLISNAQENSEKNLANASLEVAKNNWQGLKLNFSSGVLHSDMESVSAENCVRGVDSMGWTCENLGDYGNSFHREILNTFFYGFGANYTHVFADRITLGLQGNFYTTKNGVFNYYNDFFPANIPLMGDVIVPANMRINSFQDYNLRLGKVFGKKSQVHLYGKFGLNFKDIEYGLFNVYQTFQPNSEMAYRSEEVLKSYSYGGGIEFKLPHAFTLGIDYTYSTNDLEHTIHGATEPLVQQANLVEKLKNHQIALSLSYNLLEQTKTKYEVVYDTIVTYETKTKYETVYDTITVNKPANDFERKIEVGKTYVLKNIHYDFDKFNIREDAENELNLLAEYLNKNKQYKVLLNAYTDCRGSEKYNLNLSEKRAQAAADYLVRKGVSANRIYAVGYGEQNPLNKCVDGVKCSEEEYQENRRTEFTILNR